MAARTRRGKIKPGTLNCSDPLPIRQALRPAGFSNVEPARRPPCLALAPRALTASRIHYDRSPRRNRNLPGYDGNGHHPRGGAAELIE